MPTALELDYLEFAGVGLTGAVKVRLEKGLADCCGCDSGDTSLIAIYDNGSPIDLWLCQGCRCTQRAVESITVPEGANALIMSGASLPEEVCDSCCYQKRLLGTTLSDAWENGVPIKASAVDGIAASVQLATAQTKVKQLEKALASCKAKPKDGPTNPVKKGDCLDDFLTRLTADCT